MKMLRVFHRANLLTYCGLGVALLGIVLAFQGKSDLGVLCLIGAGICDLFDGPFARRFQRDQHFQKLGVQLDSLVDTVSFGLLPVSLALGLGLTAVYYWPIYFLYLLAAISRLAFFNVQQEERDSLAEPVRHYRGLPVTYSAFFLALVWLGFYILPAGVFLWLWLGIMVILGGLFLWDRPIPKPKGLAYVFYLLLAIMVSVIICVMRWA